MVAEETFDDTDNQTTGTGGTGGGGSRGGGGGERTQNESLMRRWVCLVCSEP